MADTKTFYLPDLGEGLPDATVVEWHVKEGDLVKLDAPLVSMETAKALVDVPSPYTGTVKQLHGANGEIIKTGAPLADFELDPHAKQRAEIDATGHHHQSSTTDSSKNQQSSKGLSSNKVDYLEKDDIREDEGTVVGAMISSNQVHVERLTTSGGIKALPTVRALAKKLKIDLSRVPATGPDGVITLKDVKQAAINGQASHTTAIETPAKTSTTGSLPSANRSSLSLAGKPIRTAPPSAMMSGQPEQLKGVRRNMARVMADAHAYVVPTTLVDDADLHAWIGKQDITIRLIRAIVAACKAEPALNAWFDGQNLTRTLHPQVDVGIAVDTKDGLFVPALRNADMLDASSIRAAIQRLRSQVEHRTIPASELSGYTISLSNFGMFAGRYATPVVVPPTVAIIGAGKLSHDVVAVMGGIEVHRRIPLSLTFDHRAVTGGEAARFLHTMLNDLALPN